jgi:CO/xanthine dehydrogenase FAD-binding subunit
MEPFEYRRAGSIAEAVALLNEPGLRCVPLAGSTDLVLLLKHREIQCERIVDISMVPDLHSIRQEGDCVVIGAAASFSEVIASPLVRATAPVLEQACRTVGAVQIRNMGTLGGNVANAAACADSLPALVCLNAVATVRTPEGEREWAVTDLIKAPNRTLIPKGGLLVSLRYTIPAPGSRSVFLKLGRRNAMAISRLTIAALGRLDEDGRIAEARLVPGSTTPQIVHFQSVENFLIGKIPGHDVYREAAQAAEKEMLGITGWRWSSEYKSPTLIAMTARALAQVFDPQPAGELE